MVILVSGMLVSGMGWVQAGAQEAAPLHGVVVDATGAGVAGADVIVYRDGVEVLHTTADGNGSFVFRGAPREYRVEIKGPSGFAVLETSPIPFRAGGVTRFTLQVVSTDLQGQRLHESPVHEASRNMPWEYGVLAQGGVGTEDRSNFRFFMLGGHLGKVLTQNVGSGLLRGNFEYAVEVFPFWQSYTPRFSKISCNANAGAAPGSYTCSQPYTVGGTYTGVSVTPIMLRWNLTHGQRWMPWVQGAGGVVWTNHKYPAIGNLNPLDLASNGRAGDTSVWNFTPQFGIGTHYFVRPRQSLDFSANAVHISSASLGDKNPGVNASVQFSVGYSWWK